MEIDGSYREGKIKNGNRVYWAITIRAYILSKGTIWPDF